MANPNNTDLSLVSTDDLYDEIVRRHDLSLLVVWRNAKDIEVMTRWHGGAIPCMGLAHYALTFLKETQQEEADREQEEHDVE